MYIYICTIFIHVFITINNNLFTVIMHLLTAISALEILL